MLGLIIGAVTLCRRHYLLVGVPCAAAEGGWALLCRQHLLTAVCK